jgi:glucose/mannose-6-phosphate isomerase
MEPEEYLAQMQSLPRQVQQGYELSSTVKIPRVQAIAVGGMGGSAIPGGILQNFIGDRIPVHIISDYTVPEYLTSKTLYIALSYSGNTEEALEAAKAAHRKGCTMLAMSSGGKCFACWRMQVRCAT